MQLFTILLIISLVAVLLMDIAFCRYIYRVHRRAKTKSLLRPRKLIGYSIFNIVLTIGALVAGVIWLSNNIVAQNDKEHEESGLTSEPKIISKEIREIPDGEIWGETSMVIYATTDVDICLGGEVYDLGNMYWQTSNTDVIAGFYDSARSWLGYDSKKCRSPIIKGVGSTVVTAGTYDGKYKDTITVDVVEPPVEQWKQEVLNIVNDIRKDNDLSPLSWSSACEEAADTRAKEIVTRYEHTRPDDSEWNTACPAPSGSDISGENLAAGNAAVSPTSVVKLWMDSESHRENILNPKYTKMSVGFVFAPDTEYKTYWAQLFSTY